MVKATAGDDLASLRDKTFAEFRKECRPNKDQLHEIKNPELEQAGLVFKGVAGTGVKLYDMWTREEWGSSNEAKGHYRNNSLYQAWSNGQLNVRQVKLSVYDSTGVRAELTFNGAGSNTMNWFTHDHLTSSPWDDLKSTPFNGGAGRVFSIKGHNHVEVKHRRFFINRHYGGCKNDAGWLVVTEWENCPFERETQAYPYSLIFYSATHASVTWHDVLSNAPTVGRADGLTIHIDAE